MHVALIVLSVVGLYISLYFTLVYYRVIDTSHRFVPTFCRLDKATCQLVLHHPDARVLRVPNSLLGVGYYLLMLFIGDEIDSQEFISFMKFASWVTVMLGVYLVYALFFNVKVLCPLCLAAHTINLTIALLLTIWW